MRKKKKSIRTELPWIITGYGFAGTLIGILVGIIILMLAAPLGLPWYIDMLAAFTVGGMLGATYTVNMEDLNEELWITENSRCKIFDLK